jgi:hypothetical protein
MCAHGLRGFGGRPGGHECPPRERVRGGVATVARLPCVALIVAGSVGLKVTPG